MQASSSVRVSCSIRFCTDSPLCANRMPIPAAYTLCRTRGIAEGRMGLVRTKLACGCVCPSTGQPPIRLRLLVFCPSRPAQGCAPRPQGRKAIRPALPHHEVRRISVQGPSCFRHPTKRNAFPSDVPSSARREHKRNRAHSHMQHRATDGREAVREEGERGNGAAVQSVGNGEAGSRASHRRLQIAGCHPAIRTFPPSPAAAAESLLWFKLPIKSQAKTFALRAIRAR